MKADFCFLYLLYRLCCATGFSSEPLLDLNHASSIFTFNNLSESACWQRSMLARTLSRALELSETSRRSNVLEALQLTKTLIRQTSLTAGNHQTCDGAWPGFNSTLFNVVKGVQIFVLVHGCVALDDAHCVVLAHSFESLAHGVAELAKGSTL